MTDVLASLLSTSSSCSSPPMVEPQVGHLPCSIGIPHWIGIKRGTGKEKEERERMDRARLLAHLSYLNTEPIPLPRSTHVLSGTLWG